MKSITPNIHNFPISQVFHFLEQHLLMLRWILVYQGGYLDQVLFPVYWRAPKSYPASRVWTPVRDRPWGLCRFFPAHRYVGIRVRFWECWIRLFTNIRNHLFIFVYSGLQKLLNLFFLFLLKGMEGVNLIFFINDNQILNLASFSALQLVGLVGWVARGHLVFSLHVAEFSKNTIFRIIFLRYRLLLMRW